MGFHGDPLQAIKSVAISASSSGANQVIAGTTGKRIRVLAAALIANAAVNVKFQSNTTDKTGLFYLAANDGFVLPLTEAGWFETASGVDLNLNLSGAIAVGGVLLYIQYDG